MSWTIASPVVIAGVKAVANLTKVLGLGEKLNHDVCGDDDVPMAFRSFFVKATAGSRRGPATSLANISRYDCVLAVDYPDADDRNAINAAIVSDYERISAKLMLPATWQPLSTTSIRRLGPGDGDELYPFEVVPMPNGGGKRLRVFFPCEVKT